MLAVIKLGGSQHVVKVNDIISVNKLDSNVGDEIVINDVLSTINEGNVKIGSPIVEGISVKAKILEQFKDKKVIVFKKQRRQNHRRKNGHRQQITKLQIISID